MLDLYETFYKLSADPFRLSPDHRFVLDHCSYAKSRSYLEYALHRGEGFIVITGEAGTGKTTLINELLTKLDKTHIQVATLTSTQLEARDLLHMVASSFGLPLREIDKAAILLELEDFLKQQGKKGRRAVLIVDEAQGLSHGALEELRLLANLQFNNRLLLQVFLVGQEPLRDLLDGPDMDHLRQRIVAASHLDPLKPDETVDYVEHRLNRVGWQGNPKIDAEALMLIHSFSEGIPRKINLICSRLFLFGAMEKKHELVGADAKDVIEDLQQEHLMSPMAVQRNGTTATLPCIEVPDEEFTTAFGHSLPREKKTAEEPTSASQPDSSDQHSEKSVADADQQVSAGAGEPECREAEKDTWSEIEELKQELRDSYEDFEKSEAHNDATVETANTLAANTTQPAGTVKPVSGEPGETDKPPVAPVPVDSMMAVEPRHTPRTRTSKRRHRRKRTITAVVLALLVVGFVVVVVVGTDSADRTVATVDEKIIVEQEGTIQREAPDTEGVNEPSQVSSDTPLQENTSEEPVAADSATEQSQVEAEFGRKEPVLSEPEKPLTTDEATASAGIRLPARKLTVEATPPLASPVPDPAVADAVGEGGDKAREEGAPSSIEAQRARLRAEAEERLNQRLSERLLAVEKTSKVAPPSGDQPTVATKPEVPVPSEPAKKVQPLRSRLPVKKRPVPTVIATAPRSKPRPSMSSPDRIQSTLMTGHWASRGKPAMLLPSEITHCQQEEVRINCRSVPQNIDTKYGVAAYKVEATLQDFSATGKFRLLYRTLVRLVGGNSFDSVEETTGTGSGSDHWQVTEHSMTCQLTQLSRILCHDEKGTKREYRQL